MSQCRRGHEHNEQNTYVRPDGSNECRVCRRERQARRDSWQQPCQWRHHHPGPHGHAYRRKGYSGRLCRKCWHAALGEEPGDRYQPVCLTGYFISSESGGKSGVAPVEWYVQDRDYNYRVVASFSISKGGRHKIAKQEAEFDALELCARLNREERQWAAGEFEARSAA